MLSITKLQNLKAIHNQAIRVEPEPRVVINHKTTKFESNSQQNSWRPLKIGSCYQSQNYKIWKQFTTIKDFCLIKQKLLSITKLQNLKAIHNTITQNQVCALVVINHKTTKFESNSQQAPRLSGSPMGCYQSQNYKIWKQFTTGRLYGCEGVLLLSITKLQNLKAIHNNINRRRTSIRVVINHKTTKFESNSQQEYKETKELPSCYQSQNYKIWKQFTTKNTLNCFRLMLLSITKLQNLKAIHNEGAAGSNMRLVVINHKTTKFESNSQPGGAANVISACCYQSQNYKIWKQFTTRS